MAYTVCRVEKLKGSKIRAAENHNSRADFAANANPEAVHKRLVGGGKNLEDLIENRKELTGAKIRKDGVPAMEMLLSASPEYFRPGDPGAYGKYDKQRTVEWVKKTREFLQEKYGDNLIALDLHCDEATPHMHAVITPIIEKTRKKRGKDEYYQANSFDASVMFSRDELGKLQDDYAAAVEGLGIKRGLKKSKAKHEDIKSFYAQMNEPAPKPKLGFTKKKPDENVKQYIKRTVVENLQPWVKRAQLYRQRYEKQKARTAQFDGLDPDQAKEALKQLELMKVRNAEQERQLIAFREKLGPKSSISINRLS